MARATQITTGKVRLSYANLFTPKIPVGGEKEKYSVTILIPKSDKKTLADIKTAMDEAKKEYVTKFNVNAVPKDLKTPVRDGDGEKEDGSEYGDEYKGCYFMNVASDRKPLVVDRRKQEILDVMEVYSGCYGAVQINFFPWQFKDKKTNVVMKKGISASLLAVQKIEDGENLGGVTAADVDEFKAFEDSDKAGAFDDDDGLLG